MQSTPSASYSLTLRVKLSSKAGTLGEVASAIGRAGGDIGAIDIVSVATTSLRATLPSVPFPAAMDSQSLKH